MNIKLNIDELLVHGFDTLDRQLLHTAVTSELSNLLRNDQRTIWREPDHPVRSLDGGSVDLAPSASVSQVGTAVATQIYRSIAK